jgi:hypothetical protein
MRPTNVLLGERDLCPAARCSRRALGSTLDPHAGDAVELD